MSKRSKNSLVFWNVHNMQLALDPLVKVSAMCSKVGLSLCCWIFTVFRSQEASNCRKRPEVSLLFPSLSSLSTLLQ